MRGDIVSNGHAPDERWRNERGMTLVELMLAITICGIILIPVMAWTVTAMRKGDDSGTNDDTVAMVRLNRYLKSDVASSRFGDPGPYRTSITCQGTSAADTKLSLLSSADGSLTNYVLVPAGLNDPDTGQPIQNMMRRQCVLDAATGVAGPATSDEIVSDYLIAGTSQPATVVCEPRDEWVAFPDKDPCGEVALSLNTQNGEATVRASRRVDPELDLDPTRKPVAVIKCTPACPATGIRRFTVAFDSSSSYDPAGIAGQQWEFGDGTTSYEQNPVHVYRDLGTDRIRTFKVKLTVFSNDGVGRAVARTTVTVSNATPVAAATPVAVVTNRIDYVPFDASGSVDPDAETDPGLTYLWDFGDGTTSTEATPAGGHRYRTLGDRTATLTVKDANNVTDVVEIPVSVQNKPPLACFESNQTSPVAPSPNAGACSKSPIPESVSIRSDTYPMTVTFNAQSRDEDALLPDGNIGTASIPGTSQIWYSRTEQPVGTGARTQIGVGTQITRTFTAGVHTITLEAVDQDGARSSYSVLIEVNKRPSAVITPGSGCTFNAPPYTCTLDGAGSLDEDGTVVKYDWDFGDGTTASFNAPTSTATHTWPTFGTYTVKLSVTDNVGSVASTTVRVKVNAAPTPVIGPTALNALRKKSFSFVGSGSTDDPTGTIVSYLWDFGDGTPKSNEVNPSHTYTTLGTKKVRLTVTDDDGLSAFVERNVSVTNQKPVAVIGGITSAVVQGLTANFIGSGSSDPDGVGPSPLTYYWEFGDGATSTLMDPVHTYATYGNRAVRLTVTDADGESNTQTINVRINRLPTASFTTGRAMDPGYFQINPGITLNLNGLASSDSDGSIASYSWNFSGNVSPEVFGPTAGTISQPYTVDMNGQPLSGRFSVTLTVTDDLGGTASVTHEVLIIDIPPVARITAAPAATSPGANYAAVTSNAPNTFTFTGSGSTDADGTITNYLWNFGDGTTSTAANPPAKTYPASPFRSYDVTLTVTDNWGVTHTATVKAKVNAPPIPSIAGTNPLRAGRAIPQTYTSTSTDPDGTISQYVWNWGDGTPNSFGVAPSHTYTTIGIFTLTLTVTDNDGKTATMTRNVDTTNAPPVARFTMNGSTANTLVIQGPGPVAFDGSTSSDPDDLTAGAITTYTWDFGDGSPIVSGPSPTVTHNYTAYGSPAPKLTVTDRGGATHTVTKTVKVNRAPVVAFTPSTPTLVTPDAPYSYTFDASGTTDVDGNGSLSYSWNFGNGNIRNTTSPNITFTYVGPGTFTVTLTVTDNNGGVGVLSVPNLVRANRPPTPVISYPSTNTDKRDNLEPFSWTFTSGSTDTDGTIASYLWEFGDGNSSSSASPTHTYAGVGRYDVKLTVTDNDGAARSTTITVIANGPPTALIGPATLDPKKDLPFTFDGTGSSDADGTIASYQWTFPGAATVSSLTASKPVVTWTSNGPRTVTLTVIDNDGRADTTTRNLTVTDNVAPTAAFVTTPSPANGNSNPFPVSVDGSTSSDPDGTIVDYSWNFGDGSPVVSGPTPTQTHNYTAYGNFTITLTVTDNSGVTATTTRAVRNNRPPVALVTTLPSPPTSNNPPFQVFFDGTASNDPDGTIVSYTWDFDDGTPTASGSSATHIFTTRKVFQAKLTVVDNEGASSTLVVPVKVNTPPVAVATYTPVPAKRLLPVQFDGAGSYDTDGTVVAWSWDFGDGSTASGQRVDHTYIGAQAYNATLTVTDENGGTNTKSFTVTTVNQVPVAEIITAPSPAIGDPGMSVTFDGGPSYDPDGTIVSYDWNFGDGTTGSGLQATHAFSTATPIVYGTYQVTLTVTDNSGGASVTTVDVIINRPPTATIGAVSPVRGVPVTFAGSGADTDGSITSYSWDFDDGPGSTSSQQNPTYTYQSMGSKAVKLTVTDNRGKTTTVTRNITVANRAPVAVVTGTSNTGTPAQLKGAAPLTINFNGSASSDPDNSLDALPSTEIASYAWTFGDSTTGTGATPVHVYSTSGTFTATLTVTDSDGGTHSASVSVVVAANQAPTATFTYNPTSGTSAPLTVFFDAAGSSDADGTIASYSWNFGDNTTGTGVAPSHTFTAGRWTISLTVWDNSNQPTTTTRVVTVEGTSPVPTGFRFTGESGGVNFAWDPVPGVTGYEIDMFDNDGGWNPFCGGGPWTIPLSSTATSVTVDACTTGRNYSAKIRSVNGAFYSNYSPTVSANT